MEVVSRETARQTPHALNGRELWAVRGEEEEFEVGTMGMKPRLEELGAVVTGVVKHDDHLLVTGSTPEQALQEGVEGHGVEHRREEVDELSAVQTDGAEAGDGLPRRGMEDDRILVFGWNPHATACAVALEVAFVLAPQLKVAAARQAVEFF